MLAGIDSSGNHLDVRWDLHGHDDQVDGGMIGEADGVGERKIGVEAFPGQMCAGCPGGRYGRQSEVTGGMYSRNVGESGPTAVGVGADDADAIGGCATSPPALIGSLRSACKASTNRITLTRFG